MADQRLALNTCGSADEAATIARALVERGLAACVNVVPGVRSFYRWQGKIEDDAEHLLVIKTSDDKLAALDAALAELHSYDCPELVVLPIAGGSDAYLSWWRDALVSD